MKTVPLTDLYVTSHFCPPAAVLQPLKDSCRYPAAKIQRQGTGSSQRPFDRICVSTGRRMLPSDTAEGYYFY